MVVNNRKKKSIRNNKKKRSYKKRNNDKSLRKTIKQVGGSSNIGVNYDLKYYPIEYGEENSTANHLLVTQNRKVDGDVNEIVIGWTRSTVPGKAYPKKPSEIQSLEEDGIIKVLNFGDVFKHYSKPPTRRDRREQRSPSPPRDSQGWLDWAMSGFRRPKPNDEMAQILYDKSDIESDEEFTQNHLDKVIYEMTDSENSPLLGNMEQQFGDLKNPSNFNKMYEKYGGDELYKTTIKSRENWSREFGDVKPPGRDTEKRMEDWIGKLQEYEEYIVDNIELYELFIDSIKKYKDHIENLINDKRTAWKVDLAQIKYPEGLEQAKIEFENFLIENELEGLLILPELNIKEKDWSMAVREHYPYYL